MFCVRVQKFRAIEALVVVRILRVWKVPNFYRVGSLQRMVVGTDVSVGSQNDPAGSRTQLAGFSRDEIHDFRSRALVNLFRATTFGSAACRFGGRFSLPRARWR